MIGKTISHYRIIEKLGEGGMGVVYKAVDNKLKRPVALKFISPVLTLNKEANRQFIYEAQTASSIDHQNISTIYEIDEHDDGRMFIAMAYYNGDTLSKLISKNKIPLDKVLDFTLQIAGGLLKAHQRGIVHKDIKPANIIIGDDETIKIIDFGLSKLQAKYQNDKLGSTMGTVSYMSPEQIIAKLIDCRTDIWSLGVTVYEMLSGIKPFNGDYNQEIIYSILNEEPEPIADLVADLPTEIVQIINKMIAKNLEDRYQSIENLLIDLLKLKKRLSFKSEQSFNQTDKYLIEIKNIRSIAVLPLVNLSNDPEQEYFADGMTDALITELAKIKRLKIISRTSIMLYKGAKKSLPEIAEELKVDAVVEGSVIRIDGKVQITAQLIHADSDTHLWAETYERSLKDVLILQNEVSMGIANEIDINLSEEVKRLRPVEPEPFENYLKGCFHFYKLSPEHFTIALEYFQMALTKTPDYALAYAGISNVWFARGYWGVKTPEESIPEAEKAVLKALELDDTLEEAHDVLARIKYFYHWDWDGAEKEFRKAINLNNNYADAHLFYSALLRSLKRDDEALIEVKLGLELDPINYFSRVFYIGHLMHHGNFDEAINKLIAVLKLEPNFPMAHRYLWISYHKKQMFDAAIEESIKYFHSLGKYEIVEIIRMACRNNSYKRTMEIAVEKIKRSPGNFELQPIWIARLYSYAENKIEAINWLRKAFAEREPLMVNLKVSSDWDVLQGEAEFQNLLVKMKLN